MVAIFYFQGVLICFVVLNIYCCNTGEYLEVEGGTTLSQIAEMVSDKLAFRPICALVNNKIEGLSYSLYAPKQVELTDDRSTFGRRVYVRSLCMLLYRALAEADKSLSLRIEHSISGGHFCRLFDSDGRTVRPSESFLATLSENMHRLVDRDLPFEHHETLTADAIEIFRNSGLHSKVELLESRDELYTTYYTLDGVADSYYGPLAPSTGFIGVFALAAYQDGFLLLPPSASTPERPAETHPQPKMYAAFKNHLDFNKIIGVRNIGQLNEAVRERRTSDLINVAEALHEKYIGEIAARIAESNDAGGARVVFLAGPSSSGKTTTCKRLAIHLYTNCKTPKMISLDDYFVNREDSPRDESGDYDYESLYALDLERLNSDLHALLEGREINLPTYSFELGRRIERERPLRLNHDDVLLIEGIHGLNPELVGRIESDRLFKVYVSALTSLSIDDHNWISTTDTRLLRRIVRDHRYRHTSALETIRRWPGVRRGEEKWIFPFQENADATFNSSLLFEPAVLKPYAEPLLQNVPHNVRQYAEAYRLLKFLSYFSTIPVDQIPTTSLLREFLGGSSFHY
ncbi:MAG: nucleoside kinase [Muribaculaceae bacterium]|nr:nucleoside kinase [Muribaculaceae bacterium]